MSGPRWVGADGGGALAACLFGLFGLFALGANASEPDDYDGLPAGSGQEQVFDSCAPCHSLAIVKQQRLDRAVWDEVLAWMVEEQGMPALEPAERALILDYLGRHFSPGNPR